MTDRSCPAGRPGRGGASSDPVRATWEVAEIFEDVDLSAFHPEVVRPGFERMLQQLVDRRLDGVVVAAAASATGRTLA